MPNVLVRVLSFVFAVSWLIPPGWGAVDLGVTWDADWETILEGSWGLFFTVGTALPFVVIGCLPRCAGPAFAQLWLVATALLAGLVLGGQWHGLWMVALLIVEILLVSFGRQRERWLPFDLAPAPALLALAAVGAAPWLVHAWGVARLTDDLLVPHDLTNEIDHYAVQASFAIAMVALPTVAGLWRRGRRLLAASAGISGVYFTVLCLAWPDKAAALDGGWAVAGLAWSVAVLALGLWVRPGVGRVDAAPAMQVTRPAS